MVHGTSMPINMVKSSQPRPCNEGGIVQITGAASRRRGAVHDLDTCYSVGPRRGSGDKKEAHQRETGHEDEQQGARLRHSMIFYPDTHEMPPP